jgi:hypothetical protein
VPSEERRQASGSRSSEVHAKLGTGTSTTLSVDGSVHQIKESRRLLSGVLPDDRQVRSSMGIDMRHTTKADKPIKIKTVAKAS